MFNNSRDAIGIALKKLGYSYNTEDPAQVKEATNLLVEQKPLVQSYVMDEIFDKLEGENALIGALLLRRFSYHAGEPTLTWPLPATGGHQSLRGCHVHPQGRGEQGERREVH